jgi:hypothetical protein
MLPDGSVVVELGGLYNDCPAYNHTTKQPVRPQRTYPQWLDSHVAGSVWTYQRALYYPSHLRPQGLDPKVLVALFREARASIGRVNEFVHGPRDNLNIEGKIFHDLCTAPDRPCHDVALLHSLVSDGKFARNCYSYSGKEMVIHGACPFSREGLEIMDKAGNIRVLKCPTVDRARLEDIIRSNSEYAGKLPHFAP